MTRIPKLLPLAAASACAAAAPALAATTPAPGTISKPFTQGPGAISRFDAAGVPAIRLHKPIPKGYFFTIRTVTLRAGTTRTATLGCVNDGKLASIGFVDPTHVFPQVAQRTSYAGKRTVRLRLVTDPRAEGVVSGRIYLVCRGTF